jgi:hypothetical protein
VQNALGKFEMRPPGLKTDLSAASSGTAEAVPFPKAFLKTFLSGN